MIPILCSKNGMNRHPQTTNSAFWTVVQNTWPQNLTERRINRSINTEYGYFSLGKDGLILLSPLIQLAISDRNAS